MNIIYVTTGNKYTDIDSLACAVAYTELLKLRGQKALTYLPGLLNNTITEAIKEWNMEYVDKVSDFNAKFVIVDISDPDYLSKQINLENIIEIYDHHYGFEKYWKDKLGEKAKIEAVGACATQIWEEYKLSRLEDKISNVSANLLYTAIIQNTLNFNAKVLVDRDKVAFEELKKYISLPSNWDKIYYDDREKETQDNILETITNDTKTLKIPSFDNQIIIGQLELWDVPSFLDKYASEIKASLSILGSPYWFMNLSGLKDGKNYLYAESDKLQRILEKVTGAKFKDNIGTTDRLWLRKEIVRDLQKL